MRNITLDLDDFESAREVHGALRAFLGSEEYHGSNLDALHDVLTSQGEDVCVNLIVRGKRFGRGFVNVLRDASAENRHVFATWREQ